MKSTVILLSLLIVGITHAQQSPITRPGVEEGLGHSIAYGTLQSKNGYLWFLPTTAITRYDGKHSLTSPPAMASILIS